MEDLGKILLLDDNPDDRALVIRSLNKEIRNLEIVEITNAEEFNRALQDIGDFDLVITDFQLRWSDGLEVLKKVKDLAPHIPVIMFTATGSEEIAVEAMKSGLEDYILKSPKHFGRLSASVNKTLKRKREREEASRRLELAQREWEAIFQAVGQPAFVVDETFTVLEVNRVTERIVGKSREELIGQKCHSLMHLMDKPPTACPLRALQQLDGDITESDIFEGEMYYEAFDRTFWVTCSPVMGLEGLPTKYIHIAADITPRKRLEERLRELNERLNTLVNALPDFVIFKDGEGRWLEANESALRIFQLPKDEYRGKTDEELAELTSPMYKQAFLVCDLTNEEAWRQGGIYRGEEIIPDINGDPRVYDVIKVPLFHPDGRRKALVVIGRDITELKRAEKEKEEALAKMAQAQKMEAIGTLAGGIAHEFNNVLTAIQGYIELAQLELSSEDVEAKDYLSRSQNACERAAKLVRQMLFFSRKKDMIKEPVNVNSVVERMVEVLGRVLGEDISIELDLAPRLWVVEGNEGMIEQIIMNLSLNARDAMPKGGVLTFKTENVELDETRCREVFNCTPGRYVKLSVSDTGEGMDRCVLDRIFDPFFTTKEVGKGTGLGLSVVYAMVKDLSGGIRVISSPGEGSTFEIYLPVKDGDASKKHSSSEASVEGHGGGEWVLVVEDEELVLKMLKESLSSRGYQVVPAKSCEEALSLADRSTLPFQFAVLDLVLPDGSGIELGRELSKRFPHIKTVMISGYAPPQEELERLKERGVLFLRKPFKTDEMVKALESLKTSD